MERIGAAPVQIRNRRAVRLRSLMLIVPGPVNLASPRTTSIPSLASASGDSAS